MKHHYMYSHNSASNKSTNLSLIFPLSERMLHGYLWLFLSLACPHRSGMRGWCVAHMCSAVELILSRNTVRTCGAPCALETRTDSSFFRWDFIRAVPRAPVVEATPEMHCALFCLCPATRLLVSACVAQTCFPSGNPKGAALSSFCFQQSFAFCGCHRFQSSRWQQVCS